MHPSTMVLGALDDDGGAAVADEAPALLNDAETELGGRAVAQVNGQPLVAARASASVGLYFVVRRNPHT